MFRLVIAVALALAGARAGCEDGPGQRPAGKPARAGGELSKLQGKWKLSAFSSRGQKRPVKGDYYLTIRDNAIEWSPWITGDLEPGRPERFEFALDTGSSPKTLKLTKTIPNHPEVEPDEINFRYGYEIDGAKLRIVHDSGSSETLPKSFETKVGVYMWCGSYDKVK